MSASPVKRLVRDLCPPLVWQAARHCYRRVVPPPAPPPPPPPAEAPAIRWIDTVEQLDAELAAVRALESVSHDAMLQALDGIRFRLPPLPADPRSPEYRDAQMDFYRLLSGRDGYTARECEQFEPSDDVRAHPFPYYTRSCTTIGEQLMAIGFLIRALDLRPPGRVLEMGFGYGKLTAELAQSGFRVTAVDINPAYVDLVRGHCQRNGLGVILVCSPMLDYRPAERFDRVVFYESFHHCEDPEAMVARLDGLVAPGGAVLFAGEPITDDFSMPWGVRPDGRSLWAIRTAGWLELGFRTDYFLDLLARHGWSARVLNSADVPWQRVLLARRAGEAG